MIQINQFKLKPCEDDTFIYEIAKELGVKQEDILDVQILKKSIDARKKPELYYIFSLTIQLKDAVEQKLLRRNKNVLKAVTPKSYHAPKPGTQTLKTRPVIVGFGPAGMFAAYLLARAGYQPIVIERGEPIEERISSVEKFWEKGILNPESNVQFGEGGAGTFSDGKLNTGVKDKYGRHRFVLETFVKHGAREQIMYDGKPHIGTDVLRDVVVNMRKTILDMGATILFSHKMESVIKDCNTGALKAILVKELSTGKTYEMETQCCILAIGHSARDTFEALYAKEIHLEQKPFALGLRVIHEQHFINQCQYGTDYEERYGDLLPAAPYKLTAQVNHQRGVYSFCMCPGGYVVNASSEENRCAVNGMSNVERDSGFANSAIVVSVSPKDFPDEHPLAGMHLQRELEQKTAFLGNGQIPVCFYSDFVQHKSVSELTEQKIDKYRNAIKGNFVQTDLTKLLPDEIANAFIEGMDRFEQTLPGFASGNPLLCAIESRTSSPVKILRDETFHSVTMPGLYPCGEGAGYAGGIMSAAMDGMKVAEAIISFYAPLKP